MKELLKPFEHQHDDKCGCGHDHRSHEGEHEHHHEEACGCGHEHHDHEEEHEHHHEEACGCGHAHHDHEEEHEHHHHEETCGCGHDHHDHEEKHEHHHGEACGCGHDHDHEKEHEYHHEEACGCGHDHHDHGHHEAACAVEQPQAINEQGLKEKKSIFILKNLGCANCAAKMEAKIKQLPGVEEAIITFATRQLRLYAADSAAILPDIQGICTSIESEVQVVAEKEAAKTGKQEQERKAVKERNEILIGAGLFVVGLVLDHQNFPTMALLITAIAAYLLLGGRVLLTAGRNLTKGQIFDENFLMSIATLGAFIIGDYMEAVGVMLFFRVGEYFEERAVEKSRSQIMDAIDLRPEVVNLIRGGSVVVTPAEEARVGDSLLVRPGDRIPLDGRVEEGESRIDTSPVTGEPVPLKVVAGDEVISGCVNTSGQLVMRVEKPLEESMVTRILDSVENAAASKPAIEKFITRFARVYTPIVVLLAVIIAVVPSLVTGEWQYWVYTALTFLVMSCPCALVLSVPLAFFAGIGAGSKVGILFKGGAAIEAMTRVKAIVMDKTGTITEGNFKLQKTVSLGEYPEDDLLKMSAGCELNSTHPIGSSIVSATREKGLTIDSPEQLEEIAGHGIRATVDGREVLCGNLKLMEQHNVDMSQLDSQAEYGTEVFIAVDGRLAGYLIIADTVKKDAKKAIGRLKQQNLITAMLTGDGQKSAQGVAAETGIDEVHAKLLPQDKLAELVKIRERHGAVMFVGDGINDAPVLAGADVGAAMGSGADAAIEAADVVFMTSEVEAIPQSLAIARSSSRISRQNVAFALVIKVAVMILGVCGFASMWAAVFADTGVAMLCVLNSIRTLYKK